MNTSHAPNDGLQEEFRQTALLHVDSIYRFALGLTGEETKAEELAQEALLKARRSFAFVDPRTPSRKWLLKILYNAWVGRLRQDARCPAAGEFDPNQSITEAALDEMEIAAETFDIEKLAVVIDGRLKSVLERLPDRFRVVFLLSALEGLCYDEIAQVTEMPIGTVMSRLYRARRILRRDLWQHAKALGYVKDRKRGM